MFNWPLFFLLVLICLPGLIAAIPNSMKLIEGAAKTQTGRGQKQPPRRVLLFASFIQSLLLVVLAAAVGTALAPRTGLGAPFFESIVTPGASAWSALQPQLLPAIGLGVAGAAVFVVIYFLFFGM